MTSLSMEVGSFNLDGDFEFLNNWELDLGVDVSPQALSDTETRGGPLMTEPASYGVDASVETDDRRKFAVEVGAGYERRALDAGDELDISTEFTYRPTPAWEFSVAPTWSRSRDAAQFVTSTGDVGFEPTFGARYLFSDLEQVQVA